MKLSREAIFEYQQIHLEEFGENLSMEQAEETGVKLLTLFQIITSK